MKIFIFLFLFFLSLNISAQTELTSAFNSTASGRNVSLTISKTKNKHELGIGLRYNIGMIAMPDDQGNIFYKRLNPANFAQHWGLQTFYHYHICKHWKHVKPFVFYDLQTAYSETRNSFYSPTHYVRHYGPFVWIEQCIGFGFKVDLPKNFFISQKIGAGGMLILGDDQILLKTKPASEFGGIINVGIGYRFK